MARHRDEFPRGVSLQDLEDIASSFAEEKVAPAEFTEALALTDADWIAVRLAFRRVRKTYYKLWLPDALRGQYSIPTDLLGYLNRGFQLDPAWQVCVAGLSSLDSQHMALAANAALHRLWQLSVGAWKQANDPTKPPNPDVGEQLQKELDPEDQFTETESVEQASVSQKPMAVHSVRRVPTLVVIDEAHNFAPAQPANELQARVSDKIALIAAEGRKYDLFLLLATQRPQKLRPGLLQECENACLLRIQSGAERASAAEALGVPKETVDQVGNFQQGQALLLGRWVTGYSNCFSGPARTTLGGTGIAEKDWLP